MQNLGKFINTYTQMNIIRWCFHLLLSSYVSHNLCRRRAYQNTRTHHSIHSQMVGILAEKQRSQTCSSYVWKCSKFNNQ